MSDREATRRALADDPVICRLAAELAGTDLASLCDTNRDGPPSATFAHSAAAIYADRGGRLAHHPAGPAEAVLRILRRELDICGRQPSACLAYDDDGRFMGHYARSADTFGPDYPAAVGRFRAYDQTGAFIGPAASGSEAERMIRDAYLPPPPLPRRGPEGGPETTTTHPPAPPSQGGHPVMPARTKPAGAPNAGQRKQLLLRRSAGATTDTLIAAYPKLDPDAIRTLVEDQAEVGKAYAAADPNQRKAAVTWVEAHGGSKPEPQPDPKPSEAAMAATDDAKPDDAKAQPAAGPPLPDGVTLEQLPDPVVVPIKGSGPGVPDSTVQLPRGDWLELRRLRWEGLTWAELKAKFTLPGVVIQAVAGDVDAEGGAKAKQAATDGKAAATRTRRAATTSGKPRKRYDKAGYIDIAQRVAKAGAKAGASKEQIAAAIATVAGEEELAPSTIRSTWKWAIDEGHIEDPDKPAEAEAKAS